MSNLPTVDPQDIIKRITSKNSATTADLTLQIVHLELLAEALRDERDQAVKELEQHKESQSPQEGIIVS